MATKAVKPAPTIKNAADLASKTNQLIAAFLPKLPALLTFVVEEKKSYVDGQGKRHTQDNAVLSIYTKTKKSVKTLFDQYFLGTIPTDFDANLTILGLQLGEQITKAITEKFGNLPEPTPATIPSPTPTPAQPLPAENILTKYGLSILHQTTATNAKPNGSYYIGDTGKYTGGRPKLFGISDISGFINAGYTILELPNGQLAAQVIPAVQIEMGSGQGYDVSYLKTLITMAEANFRNIETNRIMDEIAARHRFDTNYTPEERYFLDNGVWPAAVPPATTFPDSIFSQNSPYKLANNPTIYIYFNRQLHGVVNAAAFAKYFNWSGTIPSDLNQIRAILPMPDLTKYVVPANFFTGSIIS